MGTVVRFSIIGWPPVGLSLHSPSDPTHGKSDMRICATSTPPIGQARTRSPRRYSTPCCAHFNGDSYGDHFPLKRRTASRR